MPLIIVFLFFTLKASAFSEADIKLTKFEFNKYVKPQLTSIVQDYYSLITAMNPEIKNLKGIPSKIKSLKDTNFDMQSTCHHKDLGSCKIQIQNFLNTIYSIRIILQEKNDFIKKQNYTPENLLVQYNQFFNLYKQIHLLESKAQRIEISLTMNQLSKSLVTELIKDTIDLENIFNDYIIKCSDNRFRNEFHSFYSDFIRVTNNVILSENNMDVFKIKLTDFNLRVHFLNVVLTKRNQNVSKQAITLISVIHNRWNNILKVTLRR